MDLSTLKNNLYGNKYKTYEDVFDDISQIWTNCKLYNQQGSVIYIQAEKLERKSKKLIKDFKKNYLEIQKSKAQNFSSNLKQKAKEVPQAKPVL